MRYKDIVAMSNSAGFHVAQNANCSGDVCVSSNVATCTINYKLLPNSSVSYDTRYNPKSVSYKVYTKANGRGAYVKFPMTKTYIINGARVTFYAYSGTMSVKWEKSGNNRSIGLTSCYGHYTVNITPKVNFNGYDIEFTGKCKYGREAYLTMKR